MNTFKLNLMSSAIFKPPFYKYNKWHFVIQSCKRKKEKDGEDNKELHKPRQNTQQ